MAFPFDLRCESVTYDIYIYIYINTYIYIYIYIYAFPLQMHRMATCVIKVVANLKIYFWVSYITKMPLEIYSHEWNLIQKNTHMHCMHTMIPQAKAVLCTTIFHMVI